MERTMHIDGEEDSNGSPETAPTKCRRGLADISTAETQDAGRRGGRTQQPALELPLVLPLLPFSARR